MMNFELEAVVDDRDKYLHPTGTVYMLKDIIWNVKDRFIKFWAWNITWNYSALRWLFIIFW